MKNMNASNRKLTKRQKKKRVKEITNSIFLIASMFVFIVMGRYLRSYAGLVKQDNWITCIIALLLTLVCFCATMYFLVKIFITYIKKYDK